jgi:uncharacterized membrane protein
LSSGAAVSGRRGGTILIGHQAVQKTLETAIEILEKRYAKSEISREEFEQMKKDIQG